MGKPFMTVRFDKPAGAKSAPKSAPKPMPLVKPRAKAPTAAEAAIDRANRAQAMEAKENRLMRAGTKKAPQVISTTVRERTTPPKKK
jgi:hypothetical protein